MISVRKSECEKTDYDLGLGNIDRDGSIARQVEEERDDRHCERREMEIKMAEKTGESAEESEELGDSSDSDSEDDQKKEEILKEKATQEDMKKQDTEEAPLADTTTRKRKRPTSRKAIARRARACKKSRTESLSDEEEKDEPKVNDSELVVPDGKTADYLKWTKEDICNWVSKIINRRAAEVASEAIMNSKHYGEIIALLANSDPSVMRRLRISRQDFQKLRHHSIRVDDERTVIFQAQSKK